MSDQRRLWARLSVGFRESGQGGAGSGEVDMAVSRERMEIESRIERDGSPLASRCRGVVEGKKGILVVWGRLGMVCWSMFQVS